MLARVFLLLTCYTLLSSAARRRPQNGFKIAYVEIQTPDGVIALNGSESESWEPLEELPTEVQAVISASGVQWLHNVYNPELWGPSPPGELAKECNDDMRQYLMSLLNGTTWAAKSEFLKYNIFEMGRSRSQNGRR